MSLSVSIRQSRDRSRVRSRAQPRRSREKYYYDLTTSSEEDSDLEDDTNRNETEAKVAPLGIVANESQDDVTQNVVAISIAGLDDSYDSFQIDDLQLPEPTKPFTFTSDIVGELDITEETIKTEANRLLEYAEKAIEDKDVRLLFCHEVA
ncbi:hypothetical protein MMC10_011008 [Thelotrema lepadinum]|nr:hypothetical protein [Thelotrema lepadinum]